MPCWALNVSRSNLYGFVSTCVCTIVEHGSLPAVFGRVRHTGRDDVFRLRLQVDQRLQRSIWRWDARTQGCASVGAVYEVFVSCADTTGVFVVTCLERGVVWLRLFVY